MEDEKKLHWVDKLLEPRCRGLKCVSRDGESKWEKQNKKKKEGKKETKDRRQEGTAKTNSSKLS